MLETAQAEKKSILDRIDGVMRGEVGQGDGQIEDKKASLKERIKEKKAQLELKKQFVQ